MALKFSTQAQLYSDLKIRPGLRGALQGCRGLFFAFLLCFSVNQAVGPMQRPFFVPARVGLLMVLSDIA